MSLMINLILLSFLLIIAITLLRIRHLLAMVMLFGLYSFLVAGLFVVLDAPDVAFTEAAVGTGISTVLMMVTLASVKNGYEAQTHSRKRLVPMLTCLCMGALLVYGIHDIAPLGAVDAPAHIEVGKRYIESGMEETGVPNLVTAVLASYRGYDTLGEVTVVLTAGIGILLLLVRKEKPHIKSEGNNAR